MRTKKEISVKEALGQGGEIGVMPREVHVDKMNDNFCVCGYLGDGGVSKYD